MILTKEQFETQWAENTLTTTDWFDTTWALFKELEEAMKPKTCKECKLYYIASNKKSCPIIQGYSFSYPKMNFSCSWFEPKDNA